ncbi:MAG: DUF3097 family protein [Rothia sp. (in: high G+C Gram-positive bacteria)]|nr:DUF3097 family protein [Rothia sp. (in: high G+C Gram-positive bacteria)]
MDYRDSWGSADLTAPRPTEPRKIAVKPGILLEDVQSGWVGVVVSLETIGGMRVIGLEDRYGKIKKFPLGPGFLYEGQPVTVVLPVRKAQPAKQQISRSGSRAVENAPARTARASRIWVEGTHDAELIEKVWGHDLRVEGIVVEPLHGVDDLAAAIAAFGPASHRKLGILVDHLVAGSKESHIVAEALTVPGAAGNVTITGHPFIDIWQAVKPGVLGIKAWPQIPRNEDWKKGILKRFGKPYQTQEDIAQGWQAILARVNTYTDLEPALLGPVEELIDFVTLEP